MDNPLATQAGSWGRSQEALAPPSVPGGVQRLPAQDAVTHHDISGPPAVPARTDARPD